MFWIESVCDLIEFVLAFQAIMHRFNEELLNFAFQLWIDFNFESVTVDIIGTTKLFNDICIYTVNVVSRSIFIFQFIFAPR
jgi:hypothetical protein